VIMSDSKVVALKAKFKVSRWYAFWHLVIRNESMKVLIMSKKEALPTDLPQYITPDIEVSKN
jgi:hypothetical protein